MKKIFKSIYSLIPFKRYIYSAIKAFWTPSESIYRHLYFNDWFWVKVDAHRKFKLFNGTIIENEIFWNGLFGRWEKESLKVWVKLAEKSSCIIDVGANNGVYALLAKTVSPKSMIYAFEPHPFFFDVLKKNIALNNYSIKPLDSALSNTEGEILIDDYAGQTSVVKVLSTTLKKLIESEKLPIIDLIKIDVETFEPQVLAGMGNYLRSFKPTLIIEILNDEVANQITDLIGGAGYLFFDINEDSGLRRVDKISKSSSFNYLLITQDALDAVEI
jgi:FkbM family methyltransferase